MARILIVDTSVTDRVQMMNALEPDGHSVIELSDGREALDVIQENPPDLLVLDLVIVGMDGFKVMRAIREKGFALPIIVQSRMGQEAMRRHSFSVGADAFLRKPLNVPKLLDTINALLRGERPEKK